MGRPAHKPTAETRRQVWQMKAAGLTSEQIAPIMRIATTTLEKYYQYELTQGLRVATSKVIQTAYQMATSGDCPALTIFWLKTQAKWRETHRIEVSNTAYLVSATAMPKDQSAEDWLATHSPYLVGNQH